MAAKRIAFRAAIGFGTALVCAYVALLLIVNSAGFPDWASAELSRRTGYEVLAARVRLDLLLRLTLSGVTASKAARPLFQAERMLIAVSPFFVFDKTLHRVQIVKPTLQLDIEELLGSTGTTGLDIRLRHLNIEDGALVLQMGDGNALEFRPLAMTAENVDFGGTGSLSLRAGVPSLGGIVDIAVTGDRNENHATIRLDQNRAPESTNGREDKRGAPALEANLELTQRAGKPIRLSVGGKLDRMTIAAERFSGAFDLRADVTPDLKEILVAAKFAATEMPPRPHFLPIMLPEGNAALSLEGKYVPAQKQFTMTALDFVSPVGNAAANGLIHFTPPITLENMRVNLRNVMLEPLQPLLPAAVKALAVGGQIEADLELDGPWQVLRIRGITRGSGIHFKGDELSVADVNFKTPVAWDGAAFRAGRIELGGGTLALTRKNRTRIFAGQILFDGTVDKKPDEPVKVAGAIRIGKAGFASSDGSSAGENLAVSGVVTVAGQNSGTITSAGKLEVGAGEVLWGKFFADLKLQRPRLEFDADYLNERDLLRLRNVQLTLASVGGIIAKGEIERLSETPAMRLDIYSEALQAAGAFEFFVRESLHRTYPVLDRLSIGGRVGLRLQATGAVDQPTLEGELRLQRGAIGATTKNWELSGIELLLPFRVRYPAALDDQRPANLPAGFLTIGSARFGTEALPVIKAPLSLWNNKLEFQQPIRLPIYNGSLEISRVSWKDIVEAPQAVSLSLDAQRLQLLEVTKALGWHPFGGTVSASIPKIEATGESLRSQGRIEVDVFGGHAQIGELEIESPFSAVPSIKLDARFRDIQLEQASETFAFGRVTGILEGTVANLVIANGQPSQFRADVHSVEKPGVSQRISVEALNKITVLSSGSDAGALYGGLAGFFDNFRYSKLGFRATLKNDKLVLRGVESREGREYLVLGTVIPPTVNVISHTQEIAFSELLRRLERIQQSEGPQTTVQ